MTTTDSPCRIDEKGTCLFCGCSYSHYGNNPEPIKEFEAGRCCDWCNDNLVIPLRMRRSALGVSKKSATGPNTK